MTIEGKEFRAIELAQKAGVKTDTIVGRAKRPGVTLAEVLSQEKLPPSFSTRPRKPNTRKTHCRKGHEYTEENTSHSKEGWQRCRACHNAKMRRYNAEKLAGVR